MPLAYLGGTTTDERLHVIYLALIGPAAALPALLLLDRLEQWALVRRRPALRTGRIDPTDGSARGASGS